MATERTGRNTRRWSAYSTDGAAAYDIYQYGSAAPARKPERKPRKKAAPQKRVKAKLTVSPMAIFGLLAAGLMLLLVICGYVQLYEATNEVSTLSSQISDLQKSNDRLQSSYDEKIDLTQVEEKATALGMHSPNSRQTVYLNVSGRDKAEIVTTENSNIFQTIFEAIGNAAGRMLEYFR